MKKIRIPCLAIACLALASLIARRWMKHDSPPRRSVTETPAVQTVLAPIGAVAEDYLGAPACAACHEAIVESQANTHMAHALATVEEYQRQKGSLPPGEFHDDANDISYEIMTQDNKWFLKANRAGESARAPMKIVVGSGFSGLTFLNPRDSNEFQELRLSYYPASREWDFTSGQENTRPNNLDEALGELSAGRGLRCLTCHSTLLVQSGDKLDLGRSRLGVTCERCHGPGRRHVEAAWRGEFAPIGDRPFERAMQSVRSDVEWREQAAIRDLRVCGDCHGGHAINPNVPDLFLSRFPIAALPRSKCFERSLGKLLCTDCHDPHSNAEHADMSPYVQVCLRCHGASAESTSESSRESSRRRPRRPPNPVLCPVNATDGCIGCHMPKREPVFRGTFTHHRIAVHSEDRAANSPSEP